MSTLPHKIAAASLAPVFAALGDSSRLELLTRLADGKPQSIAQLTPGMGLSRQGVSKHLMILEKARLVTNVRVGRESRFSVQSDALTEARRYLERASEQWDDALGRLQDLVETK